MPGEDIYSWSTTAATNATADTGINWAEGQARSSVNNSARSMMAAHAKNRNLTSGTIGTGGSADAQTFTSGVGYTSVPAGLRVLLTINFTNTGPATLNMDGIGALPIVTGPGAAALTAGMLVATTHAEFMHASGVWYLLATTVPKLSTTGGTMTGTLTAPTLNATTFNTSTLGVSGSAAITGTLTVGTSMSLFSNAAISFLQFAATGWKLSFDPANGYLYYLNYAGTPLFTFAGNGDLVVTGSAGKPGGGLWVDSSDARIKTVLGDYNSGLTEINQLNPVRYTFKGNDKPRDTEQEFIGLVAQEVEPHMPELVKYSLGKVDGKDVSDLRILDTSALIFALVNSVQELTRRLEALEAKA